MFFFYRSYGSYLWVIELESISIYIIENNCNIIFIIMRYIAGKGVVIVLLIREINYLVFVVYQNLLIGPL